MVFRFAHTLGALTVAFDPEDDFVVSGSADTSVKLWRVYDKECAHDMLGHLDWVTKVVRGVDTPAPARPLVALRPCAAHAAHAAAQAIYAATHDTYTAAHHI